MEADTDYLIDNCITEVKKTIPKEKKNIVKMISRRT